MAKFASNAVLDAALGVVAAADRLLLLSGQPASFAAATTGALAAASMAPGDFALGNGTAGGRRLTVAARNGLVAQAGGTADHVALVDMAGGRLLYVTTCPAAPVVSGATVNVATWSVEVGAPL